MLPINKIAKRLIPFILSFALLLGLLPGLTAFAELSDELIPPELPSDYITDFDESEYVLDEVLVLYDPLEHEQEITIPYTEAFPDINFRSEVLRMVNNHDGGYRTEDSFVNQADKDILASIEYLFLSYMGISDMTGLEYFTGLITLFCSGNPLITLDVSYNTELVWLYCSNNQLTELNISNNIKLEQLMCYDNFLTLLDISNNPFLNYLLCYDNYFNSLDDVIGWQSNPNLILNDSFQFYPQYILPSDTEITDAFKDINFLTAVREIIGKPDGPIYYIDVANISYLYIPSRQISDLSGIEFFTKLNNLICSDNQLTTIDFSNNTELLSLDCSFNQITELNIINNLALRDLNCNSNQLTTLDISNNDLLSFLHCRYNYIQSPDNVIGWQSNLNMRLDETFNFNPQFYTSVDDDITNVFQDINFLSEVRRIIGKPDGPILYNDVVTIQFLHVNNMQIVDLSGIEFFTDLRTLNCENNKLIELNVSNNLLLTDLNCHNNQLTTLNISNNSFLNQLNCSNNQLTTLDLSNAWRLSGINCSNNYLELLNLKHNINLSDLLCDNNQLTTLDISNNPLFRTLQVHRNNMFSTDSVIGWQDRFLFPSDEDNRFFISYFIFYPQNVPFKGASVGSQIGELTSGIPGSVTFFVTTTEIADGTYPVTLNYTSYPSPIGFTANDIVISDNTGILTINTIESILYSQYDLVATIDGASSVFRLIVNMPGPTPGFTGWINRENTWYYYYYDFLIKGWLHVNYKWYYLDPSTGSMQTGWVEIDSTWYYLASSGAMQIGWIHVGSNWYYLSTNGAMQMGWVKVGPTWYYMGSGGAMRTGWVKVGSNWYYMSPISGAMQTGWVKVGSFWYYLASDGVMVTGIVTIDGVQYEFSSSGAYIGEVIK